MPPIIPNHSVRQAWFLAEIANGKKVRRIDLEKKFGISVATAKRDLKEIGPKIEFRGGGTNGYYQAKPSVMTGTR